MRYRILEATDVDINTLPREAFGQVTLRTSDSGKMVYHFRAGATPFLPEPYASPLVESGKAELLADEQAVIKTAQELLDGAVR